MNENPLTPVSAPQPPLSSLLFVRLGVVLLLLCDAIEVSSRYKMSFSQEIAPFYSIHRCSFLCRFVLSENPRRLFFCTPSLSSILYVHQYICVSCANLHIILFLAQLVLKYMWGCFYICTHTHTYILINYECTGVKCAIYITAHPILYWNTSQNHVHFCGVDIRHKMAIPLNT